MGIPHGLRTPNVKHSTSQLPPGDTWSWPMRSRWQIVGEALQFGSAHMFIVDWYLLYGYTNWCLGHSELCIPCFSWTCSWDLMCVTCITGTGPSLQQPDTAPPTGHSEGWFATVLPSEEKWKSTFAAPNVRCEDCWDYQFHIISFIMRLCGVILEPISTSASVTPMITATGRVPEMYSGYIAI